MNKTLKSWLSIFKNRFIFDTFMYLDSNNNPTMEMTGVVKWLSKYKIKAFGEKSALKLVRIKVDIQYPILKEYIHII